MVNGSNSQDNNLVKILFLAANPTDTARLRLDQECREIREKLQLGKLRDNFHLETRHAVRVEDITQAIFDVEPNIIHFSGHGMGGDGLVFEDSNGNPFSVESDTLAEIFELLKNQVNGVVLNACFSEIQAEAIAEHISFVIGMNNSIGDEAAIAFSSGFYKALVGNRSFEDSFKFGRIEIKSYKIPENLTPVLYKRDSQTETYPDKPSGKQKSKTNQNYLNINTGGGNYNENIKGYHVQSRQGDTINQGVSFDVGVNQGTVNVNVNNTTNKKNILAVLKQKSCPNKA